MELLKEAFPRLSRVAIFRNPVNREHDEPMRVILVTGYALGVQIRTVDVRSLDDFDKAFSVIIKEHAEALLTLPDPLAVAQAGLIADFATKNRLPAIYHRRESVEAGGLMADGPSYNDLFRRAALYVDKILKGAKPADLPVQQPTKFELVINLKTAKVLGLMLPASLLVLADTVIQ